MRQTRPDVGQLVVFSEVFAIRPGTGSKPDHPRKFVLLDNRPVEPQLVAYKASTKIGAQVVQVSQRLRVLSPCALEHVEIARRNPGRSTDAM